MEGNIFAKKSAFMHLYDTLAMFRECGNLEEAEKGIKATLLTAMKDENISLYGFIQLVRFAYSDV